MRTTFNSNIFQERLKCAIDWMDVPCHPRLYPSPYLWIQNTEYRIQNTEYRIRNIEYRIQKTEYRMELLGLTATLLTGKIVRFPQPFPGPGQELTTYPEPKALTNQCHTSLLLDDMQVQLYIKLRRFLPDRILCIYCSTGKDLCCVCSTRLWEPE